MDVSHFAPEFAARIGWGDHAGVLVVDLVRAYTEPDGPFRLSDAARAVAATAELVTAARAAHCPVVWTTVRYAADLSDGGWFVVKVPTLGVFAEGQPGHWGDLTLTPQPNELVVVKQYASAFFGTSLASTLHIAQVDTLVIAGVSTSGCVRASTVDALNHGFRPIVVREACADRETSVHESNLADLDAKSADVVDLSEAVEHLRRQRVDLVASG